MTKKSLPLSINNNIAIVVPDDILIREECIQNVWFILCSLHFNYNMFLKCVLAKNEIMTDIAKETLSKTLKKL